ncbi:MAG: AAA family ATPase [Dehalococcoidia bacterium]
MAKNPEVLIVDQDAIARADMVKSVKGTSFHVAGEAVLGTEAAATAFDLGPDIILVHVEEPSQRPLQTTEALANALPGTPIVVYSTLTDSASIRRAMKSGARDYIPLPIDSDELETVLTEVLEHEERRALGGTTAVTDAAVRATVITVFSAKGGVGKSTLSVNLAAALAQETGHSVVLCDLDPSFGDVATLLDLKPEFTLLDTVNNLGFLNRGNIREFTTRHPSGISVLPGPRTFESWNEIAPSQVTQIVNLLAETFDYVVIDTPGSLNELVFAALEACSIALLVTSTDVTSVSGTKDALDLLRSWSFPAERLKIAINYAYGKNGISAEDVSAAIGSEVFWQVPYDKAAAMANQLGDPAVLSRPGDKMSQNVVKLARSFAGAGSTGVSLLSRLRNRKRKGGSSAVEPEQFVRRVGRASAPQGNPANEELLFQRIDSGSYYVDEAGHGEAAPGWDQAPLEGDSAAAPPPHSPADSPWMNFELPPVPSTQAEAASPQPAAEEEFVWDPEAADDAAWDVVEAWTHPRPEAADWWEDDSPSSSHSSDTRKLARSEPPRDEPYAPNDFTRWLEEGTGPPPGQAPADPGPATGKPDESGENRGASVLPASLSGHRERRRAVERKSPWDTLLDSRLSA